MHTQSSGLGLLLEEEQALCTDGVQIKLYYDITMKFNLIPFDLRIATEARKTVLLLKRTALSQKS